MEDKERMKEELLELEASLRMNELRMEALLNILAKEGVVSKEEFKAELGRLCEKE
ncbi:hypothetical protein KY359_06040 [Candidatus Woesearchaeota archaeon]|nr:hypothetical protein [Candidatus Woesearchaeota archaeon]